MKAGLVSFPGRGLRREGVFWTRAELNALFGLYGRQVAAGLWRDYGLGAGRDHAVFAVYRRAHDAPLYRIEKRPHLPHTPYAVIASGGLIVRRGQDLPALLRIFDKRRWRLIAR